MGRRAHAPAGPPHLEALPQVLDGLLHGLAVPDVAGEGQAGDGERAPIHRQGNQNLPLIGPAVAGVAVGGIRHYRIACREGVIAVEGRIGPIRRSMPPTTVQDALATVPDRAHVRIPPCPRPVRADGAHVERLHVAVHE